MLYVYPKPQTPYNKTVFLIAETVLENKYDEYMIPYKAESQIRNKIISHKLLLECIEKGIVKILQKPGAFNDKEFLRIPIDIQLQLF